jgi:NAD(P)-dependent dehydrogenase (short-subunit alcohol dehydrogenase family)
LARRGRAVRLDYSASKGAITVFTYSLSQAFAEEGIRVNGVAPGPIWAPLIPSTFPAKDVETLAPMFHPVVPVSRRKLR